MPTLNKVSDYRKSLFVVGVLVILLIAVELFSWVLIKVAGGGAPSFPFYGIGSAPIAPCERFVFDLYLSNIHDASAGCDIKGGVARQAFVRYVASSSSKRPIPIVTLGGSTTDGYFQHFAEGNTWPYLLSRACNSENGLGCEIINGGAGGYSSSRELRKFSRDVLLLEPHPDIVISFNGINDIYGYDGPVELTYPYYNKDQVLALNSEKFPRMGESVTAFPNTLRALRRISELAAKRETKGLLSHPSYVDSLPRSNLSSKGALWKRNVTLMKKLADSIDAHYLVFLQPTLGLYGVDQQQLGRGDKALLVDTDKAYLDNLNTTYTELKAECKNLGFCIDLTAIFENNGFDHYFDIRHPNARGNQIIATKIFEELKLRKLLPAR